MSYLKEEFINIKVIGVGGAGGKAIQRMINSSLEGVNFIYVDTDLQALKESQISTTLHLGEKLTKGLWDISNPEFGRKAAHESISSIKEIIADADMVFIIAGMGGGSGTGAAPIIAQVSKELGILTVGIVSKPFDFEGWQYTTLAGGGITELLKHTDSLIAIPNERLRTIENKNAKSFEMFKYSDEMLYTAVRDIVDLTTYSGLICLDFADVKTCLFESGLAMMGTCIAKGKNRAKEAATQAIMSPLFDNISIKRAKNIIYIISASSDISLDEIDEISNIILEAAHQDANIIFSVIFGESIDDELRVTVIATGIGATG